MHKLNFIESKIQENRKKDAEEGVPVPKPQLKELCVAEEFFLCLLSMNSFVLMVNEINN